VGVVFLAVLGVLLLVVGLLLQTLAGSSVGAWIAIAGLFVAFGSQIGAHVWAERHKDDFR
jgi:predicted histidine transporter YuiF (NhaC family)